MLAAGFAASLALLVVSPWTVKVKGADHREAPLINEDPAADIADVFAFVNPNDPTKVIFAMTVNGFAVPAVRASYSFSPDVLYQIKIDNDGNGREDLVIQFRFEGFESVRDPRCPANAAGQGGQFVTVRGPAKPTDTGAKNNDLKGKVPQATGCTNTTIASGEVRVFAGLRDDPFVTDVGQLNRILTGAQDVFRGFTSPALGALRGRALQPDGSGVDSFGGFNVSALEVEVPKALIQGTKDRAGTYLGNNTTIGVWGTTSRQEIEQLSTKKDPKSKGPFIQIQRAGHQIIKTVFIPVPMRDFFNRSVPKDDEANFSQFFPDALTTADNDGTGNTIAGRAALLDAVGVTALPNGAPLLLPAAFPNANRDLIREALLPDVLRLNLALPPGDLAIGANGLQNGRRLGDDVTDILLRVARQLADVRFPSGSGLPGSGALGSRIALDCSVLPACPDRRVLAVLQGTDFIEADSQVEDLSQSGNDRALLSDFPIFATPHPLPGNAGTVGFPPQE
jgi:hypothetical protein